MKEISLGGIGALVLFFLGVAFGAISNIGVSSFIFKDYIPALVSLPAAFGGAWFAFRLHDQKDKKKEHEANICAGNVAIFNLLCKVNKLLNYQAQIIEPVRDKSTTFLDLPVTANQFGYISPLDLNSLAFFTKSKDSDLLNLLMEIAIEDERFQSTIEAITQRAQFYRQEVHSRLEQANNRYGKECTLEQCEEVLGNRVVITLKKATTQVVENVDKTIISMQGVVKKLTASLKQLYPDATIMTLVSVGENQTQKEEQ